MRVTSTVVKETRCREQRALPKLTPKWTITFYFYLLISDLNDFHHSPFHYVLFVTAFQTKSHAGQFTLIFNGIHNAPSHTEFYQFFKNTFIQWRYSLKTVSCFVTNYCDEACDETGCAGQPAGIRNLRSRRLTSQWDACLHRHQQCLRAVALQQHCTAFRSYSNFLLTASLKLNMLSGWQICIRTLS